MESSPTRRVKFVYSCDGVEQDDAITFPPRADGSFARWLEREGVDPDTTEDEWFCQCATLFYNETLRPGERPRVFVRLLAESREHAQ